MKAFLSERNVLFKQLSPGDCFLIGTNDDIGMKITTGITYYIDDSAINPDTVNAVNLSNGLELCIDNDEEVLFLPNAVIYANVGGVSRKIHYIANNFSKLKKAFTEPPESVFIDVVHIGTLMNDSLYMVCPSPAVCDFWETRKTALENAVISTFHVAPQIVITLKEDYDHNCYSLFGERELFEDESGLNPETISELKKKISFDDIEIDTND